MTATAPEAAFLHAILEQPENDTPRLVYADYLEEHDIDRERAELIHTQCELASLPTCGHSEAERVRHQLTCYCCLLSCRQWDCLYAEKDRWLDWAQPLSSLLEYEAPAWARTGDEPWKFSRGFVEEIRLTCAEFLEHAASIFGQMPIQKVRLTDRLPYTLKRSLAGATSDLWIWHRSGDGLPSQIPEALLDTRSTRYGYVAQSEAAAWDWLSATCVAYGRQQAGLPALTAKATP